MQSLLVIVMTNIRILDKLKYLNKLHFTEKEKIEFIEKLYKLANISFSEYIKNWQTNSKEYTKLNP